MNRKPRMHANPKRWCAMAGLLLLTAGPLQATPLDDHIAEFKDATAQTEAAVSRILQDGLGENRSALAFAAVKPWLEANPSSSQQVLFNAAKAAERAGDGLASASFYRKLLKNRSIDPKLAAEAVPAVYRLLLNHLGNPNAAYLFMREDGARLRDFGRARQFDDWFLQQALERGDLVGLADWLTAIHDSGNPADSPRRFAGATESLLRELETFQHDGDELFTALQSLAAAKNTPPGVKARLLWVMEIVPCNKKVSELIHGRKEVPGELFDGPLRAAAALAAELPYKGARIVTDGWMHFNEGDSGVFSTCIAPRRAEKAAPLLKTLAGLPADRARELLGRRVAAAKSRVVGQYLLSRAELFDFAAKHPAVFNSLSAPDIPLFSPEMTVGEAKAIAPLLARDPHPDAALIRAIAASNSMEPAAIAQAIVKSEMWRFQNVKPVVELLSHVGGKRQAAPKKNLKLHESRDAETLRLKKQIEKKASSRDRLAAFDTLRKDLLGPAPRIRGALGLWDELFAKSSDADNATMLKTLASNLRGDGYYLLERAVPNAKIGGHTLFWRPDRGDNYMRNEKQRARYRAATAPVLAKLQPILKSQAQSGRLSELLFGIWLHAADPQDESARSLIEDLSGSAAYANLDPAYRKAATDSEHFGSAALTPAQAAADPAHVSQELLELPENATPAQVEAALKTVVDRAAKAPEPVSVLGLMKVAALPEWSAPTRGLILSLFEENAPLGPYPDKQGYEPLIVRLTKDLRAADQWGVIEPFASGLWSAAAATDDGRYYRGAEALSQFAEAALEGGLSSIAMTVAHTGGKSAVGRTLAANAQTNLAQITGRLRQVAGKAAVAIGAVEIPVDETDPAYPIYKSNSEFALGNLDSAWSLYEKNAGQLLPVLRKLPVDFGFWILHRNIEQGRTDEAGELVKELTIWSRQAEGTFSPEQDARLKIAYADLAFRKGALPTARAWYRKVADAAEMQGTAVFLDAALGSVKVDRVAKDFSTALNDLDKLMRLPDPAFRIRVRQARAEVLMDQENYADALDELEAVLRQEPKNADALILRGQVQYQMRKLVEASEIELGPSQNDTVVVPGEVVKINLRDPTLNVSGLGADIEIEIWAKSGDRERVLLHQLGDSKEKFRAEVPTALGPPTPGDKTLQVLGKDEIRFGYSKRFRAMMDDLPPDPDMAISVASDAYLALTAGAFPPREGERRLNVEELGLSTAQAALGTRAVRPGNPIYLRVTDPDRSVTPGIDEIAVSLQASSGDGIRRLALTETGPFSGEFEAVVPTTGAQALAFASESAPGRDPNMAISSKDYPGWQGEVGEKETARTFGVDLNDNVALGKMAVDTGGAGQSLTHFVLQTSMNGRDWTTGARYPADPAPWDGRPRIDSFPTYRGGVAVSDPKGRELPDDWREKMELTSAAPSVKYLSAIVTGLSAEDLPVVDTGHPGYSGLFRYRAIFYQPSAAIRRFKLNGYPVASDEGKIPTIFLLEGKPADPDSEDPLAIRRELEPGLHEIEIWRQEGRDNFQKRKPVLLCDQPGREELVPCPDAMFDPSTFPEGVRSAIPQPATISPDADGGFQVSFGEGTRARMLRLVIEGFEGVAPTIRKLRLSDREGKVLLPVALDYMALRENTQLEVLPGDRITARYLDPVSATPHRERHEKSLGVAYNTGTITASFLNYEMNKEGERVLKLEPIRRFRYDDAVAIVIDDADLDGSPERDTIEFSVTSSGGRSATLKAVETEEHSGRFMGRVFPVEGEASRASEITVGKGGTLTATYRDTENLDPGIPADRTVTISHAAFSHPVLSAYTLSSEALPPPPAVAEEPETGRETKRTIGPEVVVPRRSLTYTHTAVADEPLAAVIGAGLRFDVVAPHLALTGSSEIRGYVQTKAARQAAGASGKSFDVTVPGTLKISGKLGADAVEVPQGFVLAGRPIPPTNEPPLEEGRFAFTIPLILGNPPARSFATKAAAELPDSAIPDGLAVKAGDMVCIGFPWQDEDDQVHWETAEFAVGSHAFLDVMDSGYREPLESAYVGEKVYLRLLAPGLDRGPERDVTEVGLRGTGGADTSFQLKETEGHSGVFKGVFAIAYADAAVPEKLPPVELNGFPVRYGDEITVSYEDQSRAVEVNKGADGVIEPFSKRYTGDEMAVRTGFTLAECYFELAKKHREMEQESLARREIGQARKLLAEALATHRDDELKAHAEYLLGNLAQEFADLAKNDEARLPMYQDALARFAKIPADYPDTAFAPKAQFKTGLVYEKMGETGNAVEEYVKLAYKYPHDELIPTVMSRLGGYFQNQGMEFKKQADPLREKQDDPSRAEVLKYDELSYPQFLNAAMVFSKLQERFPDDPLAGLAGLRAAQNFMRALQYDKAITQFARVIDNENYDDSDIRAQAIYWSGLCYERDAALMSEGNWKGHGKAIQEAYQLYRRVTFDFPDSKWAKYARGRLADPVFEPIITREAKERERMIESLKKQNR